MAPRLCFLLIILCALIGTSNQQKKMLRKRLGYIESVIGDINIMVGRTQMDITELQEAVELLQNKSDDNSPCDKDQPPIDTTELEAKLKQQDVTVKMITKVFNDEKVYVRERENEISAIKSEVMESRKANEKFREQIQATNQVNNKLIQRLRDVKSDLRDTNQVNNKLNLELQKVQADLVKFKNKQATLDLVEENKDEILLLKQMMMEMQQKKTECCAATATPTPHTTTEPTTTTVTTTRTTATTTEPQTTTVPEILSTCPDGWDKFQHTCYLHVKTSVNWDVANRRCADLGGILAEPDTTHKFQFLDQLSDGRAPWLGVTDRQAEGTWAWGSSRRPVDSSLWVPGQPDSYLGDEDCVFMHGGGLHDGECRLNGPYICERVANE